MLHGGMCFPTQCPLETPNRNHTISWARLYQTTNIQWQHACPHCNRVISDYIELHSLFYSMKAKEEASDGDSVAQWDMFWLASALESTIHDFSTSPLFLQQQLCVNCPANKRGGEKKKKPNPWIQIYRAHDFLFSFEMENLSTDVQIYTPPAASSLLLTFTRAFYNLKYAEASDYSGMFSITALSPLNVPSNPTWAVVLLLTVLLSLLQAFLHSMTTCFAEIVFHFPKCTTVQYRANNLTRNLKLSS